MSLTLQTEIPRAFLPLTEPKRYKAVYGGRGGAKSHFFAEQLILKCYSKKTRAVCIREVQNSIKESVRQLLVDKIQKLGLGSFFNVLEGEIRGANGSLVIFKGMQVYNAENIKSLEDYDLAWVEEAQTFSAVSLRLLRPTIRKDGSELWFSWNPRYDNDPVDEFFRGKKGHPSATVLSVSYKDNPWFPDVLREELAFDRESDPEMAHHVWDGGYQIITEGAYYARLIADAENEGRIGDFPYNPKIKIRTGWDIGVDDYTSVWFFQEEPGRTTVVDYFEASGYGAEQVVRECMPELIPDDGEKLAGLKELGRDQSFAYEKHYLPHDVKNREWGAGARTRRHTLMGLGVKPIMIGGMQGPAERINATRKLLPVVRFNKTDRVMVGVSRLRRYSRKFNDALGTYTTPLHDINSHGADGFGEYAINSPLALLPRDKPKEKRDKYRAKLRRMETESNNWKTA